MTANKQPRRANRKCSRVPPRWSGCCKAAGGCRSHQLTHQDKPSSQAMSTGSTGGPLVSRSGSSSSVGGSSASGSGSASLGPPSEANPSSDLSTVGCLYARPLKVQQLEGQFRVASKGLRNLLEADIYGRYRVRATSPFAASRSGASSATLLICKAWLRIATPLLYHVIFRSRVQARALQAALRGNPDLGRFIRMLRLEGGFGPAMHHILKETPNVMDIVISLQIYASDLTAGVVPNINPTRSLSSRRVPAQQARDSAGQFYLEMRGDVHESRKPSSPSRTSTPPATVKRLSFLALSPARGVDAVQRLAQNSALEAIELLVQPEKDYCLVTLLHWLETR
ncbi:hypothetical protein DFH09DRAFT_1272735 [Mycena vulgaris]|nr:hypothetical protein DFH09DRAFT_1272735 [Mycena vulgaris]